MKYIFLSIFVLLATQPLPVTACDMHDAQEMSHMQHGDMQDDAETEMEMEMDCCDPDPSDPSKTCDSMSHCGANTAPVVAISSTPLNILFSMASQQHGAYASHPPSRFSSPPFRPPIA